MKKKQEMQHRYIKKLTNFIPAVVLISAVAAQPVLAEETIEFGDITVTSTTIDDRFQGKRTEASNIAAISGEEVDKAHTESIKQVLQSVPGITTEYDSGDTLKIHIRGVENQVYMGEKPGVAIVIDGVPVFERTGKVNIDLDNIESIKVVKGGASYLFGDDALSGAVIITTKRGAKYAGLNLAAEAGSFGYQKGIARYGFSTEKLNGHVQVSQREADGYYDDSDYKASYVDGKLQYYIGDAADLTFGFEVADREKNSHGSVKGVTAAKTDPKSENIAYNDYANHFDVDLGKFYLTYARDTSAKGNLMVNLYQFGDNTEFVSSPVKGTEDDYNYDNDYAQVQRGLKTEFRKGGTGLGWMAGLDLRSNSYDNKTICLQTSPWGACATGPGTVSGDNETAEQVQAVYAEAKKGITDRLVLTANGRYDHINLDYSDNLDPTIDDDKSFDVGSYRLGANYAVSSKMDIYANGSTGFRAPSVEQLFLGSSSPSHKTAANPDLDEETSTNVELGLRAATNIGDLPVDIDIAIFQLDRKDHIRASGGQYSTDADSTYENIGDMRNRGLELSARTDPSKAISVDIAYTYLNAIFTDYEEFNQQLEPQGGVCPAGTTPVTQTTWPGPVVTVVNCLKEYDNTDNKTPRVPEHHLNLAVNVRPATGLLVTAELDAISDYYADEINQEKIDGHETVNLLVNYDRKIGQNKWSFFARVDNLFDKNYYNTARSSSSDGNDDGVYDGEDVSIVVNQGITYAAGASVKF
ncbi:MAG: TonB-dependent receptor [bacterium]|nr:TonB-dependent receptor [bacterium]